MAYPVEDWWRGALASAKATRGQGVKSKGFPMVLRGYGVIECRESSTLAQKAREESLALFLRRQRCRSSRWSLSGGGKQPHREPRNGRDTTGGGKQWQA